MLEHLLHAFREDKIEQSQVKHRGGETQRRQRLLRRQSTPDHNKSHAPLGIPFVKVKTGNQFHFIRASERSL